MTKLFTSTWMTALLSAVIYLGATVAFWKKPVLPPRINLPATDPRKGASWEFVNPEADELIAELKTEKKALQAKEQQIGELTLRLQTERDELNQATQAVHQLQVDFDHNVVRVQDEETANLKKLAKVYADMTPEAAAAIFAELDDTSVVKIMAFMKDAETAAIFESLAKKGQPDAHRVANLSERLRLAAVRNPAAK